MRACSARKETYREYLQHITVKLNRYNRCSLGLEIMYDIGVRSGLQQPCAKPDETRRQGRHHRTQIGVTEDRPG